MRNTPNVSTSGTPKRRRIVDPRYSSSSLSSLMMPISRAWYRTAELQSVRKQTLG